MSAESRGSERASGAGGDRKSMGLVGTSPALERLREEIRDLAPFDEPVLILGETGVGKELAARALHSRSSRGDRPLQVVNCGALTGELLAAELFGHRAGTFTGARSDRRGRILAARGSSLLLDEISETPAALQVALLRAVEYREIQPVGSDNSVQAVDVRYLATSNRSLDELRDGVALRHDLFHRLAALTIRIPPLRERREDLPVLVEHFLEGLHRRHGHRRRLDSGGLELLRHHPFPGNVRELRHLLMRAYARTRGDVIEVEEIARAISCTGGTAPARADDAAARSLALQDVIRAHIRMVLGVADGNLSRAARLMDLPRSTLQHYLVKYGVEESDDLEQAQNQ